MIVRRRQGRERSFISASSARRDDLAGAPPSFDGHVRRTDAGVRGSGSRHRCQPCGRLGASLSKQSASLRQENAQKRHSPRTKRNLAHASRVNEKRCHELGAAGTRRPRRHGPTQSHTATLSSDLDAARSRAGRAAPDPEPSPMRIASAAFHIAPSAPKSAQTPAQIEPEKARFEPKSGQFMPDAALFVPSPQTLRVGLRSGSQSHSENRFRDGCRLSSEQHCPSTQARPSTQPRPEGAGGFTAREASARRDHDDVCLGASMEAGIEAGAIAMCPDRPPRKPLRVKGLGDKLGYPQATFVPPLILLHQP